MKIFLIIACLSALSFSGVALDSDKNFEKRRQFERTLFFEPNQESKTNLQINMQNSLDELIAVNGLSDLMTLRAVEGIAEVHKYLAEISIQPTAHKVVFLDLDQSLFPGGGFSWLDCVFSKILISKRGPFYDLLKQYGFHSRTEFKEWGASNTPTPLSRCGCLFYSQTSVLDNNVSDILNAWHNQEMNIYGLTARGCEKNDDILNVNETLAESGIELAKLSKISIEKSELKFSESQDFNSGVIYTSGSEKFGIAGAAIIFLDVYLTKLLRKKTISSLEIIVVDDNNKIFDEIVGSSNVEGLRNLEKKFNIKIHLRVFQPYEHYWLDPYNNWDLIEHNFPGVEKEQIAFKAMKEFLETFKTPLEQCLSGSFEDEGSEDEEESEDACLQQ